MRGATWWSLSVAVIAVVVVMPLVSAGGAAAETTLQIDPGYAGAFVPGRPVPVRVGISADRLVRATLEVTVGATSGGVPVAMAVEVPGGSQKQFLVVAGTSYDAAPTVVARLRQDGRVVGCRRDPGGGGVRPGTGRSPSRRAAGPQPAGPGRAGRRRRDGRFAAVGEGELQAAPASLGPLSTLAMGADEMARLAPGARTGVLSWMADGGRLLVDIERGRPVPGLPDDWQPGARGRASAGQGEVVVTEGAMAAGRWANLVEPTDRTAVSSRASTDRSVASSLASAAGLRSPQIGWLVGFLVLYVVVAGPVVFLAVRRRRRPELAWVVVPLVAVLFSTGSYTVGRNLRKATQLVHGTILSDGPAGPTATTYLGVFSRGGQTARIGFPLGWSTEPDPRSVSSSVGVAEVSVGPDGPEMSVPLDAGQFATVAASGPVASGAGLEVSASAGAGGRVSGRVRNTTTFRLDEVAVFAGSDGALVGTLAPGETRDWSLTNPTAPGKGGAEFRVWNNSLRFGDPAALVDLGLWQAATRAGGASLRPAGTVVAGGWTRNFSPTVRVDGRTAAPGGRTVVMGRAPVRPGGPGDPIDVAVRQDVVRDPFSDRSGFVGGARASVVRFVLPADVPPGGLVLRSPFGAAEFWIDGAWRTTGCDATTCQGSQFGPGIISGQIGGGPICPPNVPCPPQPRVAIAQPAAPAPLPVPGAAVRNGVVYARIQGPASVDQGVQITLGRA